LLSGYLVRCEFKEGDLMPKSENNMNSIDQAILECTEYINANTRLARMILMGLLLLGMIVFTIVFYLFQVSRFASLPISSQVTTSTSSSFTYGFLVLFSIIIGVLVALYRFHLKEISRTEHYKIGFMRVRIAANNTTPGFSSEVRRCLTDAAFTYESSRSKKEDKVESPLPGHPTSDIATAILNKVLDAVEISVEKRQK
jgi:hypothetical protein